jgi:hypothetical protein
VSAGTAIRLCLAGLLALVTSAVLASGASALSTLAVEPAEIDFGVRVPGSEANQSVTVRNLGPDAVALTDAVLIGDVDPFYFSGGSCELDVVMAANSECQLGLLFAPSLDESGDYEVVLAVEAGENEPATARLSAKSRPPGQLVTSPASVDFGAVPVGATSSTQVVRVHNDGGSPIAIDSVWVNGFHAIVSDGCGREVAPLATCDIGLAYRPTPGSVTSERSAQPGTLEIAALGWDQMPPRRLRLSVPLRSTALMASGKPYPSQLELSSSIRSNLARLATAANRLVRGGPSRSLELPAFVNGPYGLLGVTMRGRVGKRWVSLANPTSMVQPESSVSLRFRLTKPARRVLKGAKPVRIEAIARFGASDRSIVEAATKRATIRPPAKKKPAKKPMHRR